MFHILYLLDSLPPQTLKISCFTGKAYERRKEIEGSRRKKDKEEESQRAEIEEIPNR